VVVVTEKVEQVADKVIDISSVLNKEIAASQHKIDKWLRVCGEDKATAFWSFARKVRTAPRIHAYLQAHDCDVSQSATYRWVDSNLKAGHQAAAINKAVEGYEGVDVLGVLSATAATTHSMMSTFKAIIEEAAKSGQLDLDLKSVLSTYPALSRELRSTLATIEETRNALDTEALILTGADRLCAILLNSPTIKDTAEEGWIAETIKAAMQRIREEIKAA
jgi:hypothetical protein